MRQLAIVTLLFLAFASTTLATNYIQCAEDILNLIPVLEQLVQDAQSQNYAGVIAEAEQILSAAPQLESDCGFSVPLVEITISDGDLNQCIQDIESVVSIIQGVIANPDDISNDISAIETIIQSVGQITSDCKDVFVVKAN